MRWGGARSAGPAVWILAVAGAAGCSAAGQYVRTTGACAEQRDTCEARCARLGDQRDCLASCLLDARLCMRAQGDTAPLVGAAPARISEDKALLVDLVGQRPQHSPELKVTLGGPIEVVDAAHQLAPGGRIAVTFTLPEDIREAEIALAHAPVGDGTNCFVTITLGDATLAGRYAPPRGKDGRLTVETWNLTPQINALDPEARTRPLTLFVYNNDAAGSTAPYRLGSIQFFYRTLKLEGQPAEAPGNRAVSAPR